MYDVITSSNIATCKQKYEIKWENELNLTVDKSWWKVHNQIIFKTSKDNQSPVCRRFPVNFIIKVLQSAIPTAFLINESVTLQVQRWNSAEQKLKEDTQQEQTKS